MATSQGCFHGAISGGVRLSDGSQGYYNRQKYHRIAARAHMRFKETFPTSSIHLFSPFARGEVDRIAPYLEPSTLQGVLASDYGNAFMFERLWVYPLDNHLGFITEDYTLQIVVWNADRFNNATLTAVTVEGETGTYFNTPSLPMIIPKYSTEVFDIIIYQDGPPSQNTTYTFTIDGVDYEIEITGLRILPWYPDPNWESPPELTYEFHTIVLTTPTFDEQRRALSKESWKALSASYDIANSLSRIAFNILSYGHDKIFGVPIYNEKLTPVIAAKTSTFITVAEDFSYYYELNHGSGYVVLVDHISGLAEIKKIYSLETGNKKINLTQTIANTFNLSTTNVYPVLFSIIQALDGSLTTDDFQQAKVDFKEYKSGS